MYLFFLTGCSDKQENLNDKVKSEIDYFSIKFINILNRLNNITFENYQVTTEKAELSKESAENEKTSETSSSQSSKEEQGSVESSNGNKSSQNTIIASQMSPNTILNPVESQIDWAGIKNEIENIYYSWNTVLLDLYELDIDNDAILGLSRDLDVATTYIKKEDKVGSLLAMANLYKYLPQFAEKVSEEQVYRNIFKTRYFILNAYSLVETGNWSSVSGEIDKALEAFKLVTSDANFISQNAYNSNKVYVLLNELKNSLELQDKEIFYIKYRNLMEEIRELS